MTIEHLNLEKNPLEFLLNDLEITEIITTGPSSIWFEKGGKLHQHTEHFTSATDYEKFMEFVFLQSQTFLTYEDPFAEGKYNDFRLSMVSKDITQDYIHMSLRRHPKTKWTIEKLVSLNWCTDEEAMQLKKLILDKHNFLIIGATGSGKTTVVNALLSEIKDNERAVIIEDTQELAIPNQISSRLLTRDDKNGTNKSINQNILVKKTLRLRPDRIVLGEIRGEEAKDFLMALATGHEGSFGTLHANNPSQALIRLEMLIQMGAPQWEITAIRKLIHLSLKNILVTKKTSSGQRKFDGLFQITSLEESGFLLERLI